MIFSATCVTFIKFDLEFTFWKCNAMLCYAMLCLLCEEYNHCAVCARPFADGTIKWITPRCVAKGISPRDGRLVKRTENVPVCGACLTPQERRNDPDWPTWQPQTFWCDGCGHPMLLRTRVPGSRRRLFCSDACRLMVTRMRRKVAEATCRTCGKVFTPARKDAAYCSSPCRQKAYRQRRPATASSTAALAAATA
jgi:hypothetical protein